MTPVFTGHQLTQPDQAGTMTNWDVGNRGKNLGKHGVSDLECEEIFFNQPLLVAIDDGDSQGEDRCFVLGRTNRGRRHFLVFTPRRLRIRVISARDMTKAEKAIYPV